MSSWKIPDQWYILTNIFVDSVVHVTNGTLNGTANRSFISTLGHPTLLYLNEELMVSIIMKGFNCSLSVANNNIVSTECDGIFKAYVFSGVIYVDIILIHNSISVDQISSSYSGVHEVTRDHTEH